MEGCVEPQHSRANHVHDQRCQHDADSGDRRETCRACGTVVGDDRVVRRGLLSRVATAGPVSSMPLNRNDAAFYLVLAHNMVEHGVYSHQQVEPFAPHTEWPPGVPLWYAVPMSLIGSFPPGSSAWIIRVWTLATAVLALRLVQRYLKLFCSNGVSLAITAATAFSAALLDEAQAAFADIPALAASFFVLFEIEKHFATERTSRGRSIILHLSMAALPLVKPYLGVVFVAYLSKLFSHGGWALVALCCVPFIAFMTYSVIAAREAGTISAVTWLTTDNPVAMREGAAAAADQKTLSEWISAATNAARFHLIYHIASSPLPLLEATHLSDWPAVPRLATTLGMLILFGVGIVRSLRRAEGAAAAYTIAVLAVFSLLACDGSRYFIILTPLCAAMIWSGVTCTVRSLIGTPIDVPDCGSTRCSCRPSWSAPLAPACCGPSSVVKAASIPIRFIGTCTHRCFSFEIVTTLKSSLCRIRCVRSRSSRLASASSLMPSSSLCPKPNRPRRCLSLWVTTFAVRSALKPANR